MRHRHLPFLITQLVTGLAFPATINAATVTTCNEAGFRAAIAQGGTVNFACDGTITLTNTIEVTNSITLDGTGRQVVISGGGQVRLFQVNTGVVFSARHLTFSDGRDQGTNAPSSTPSPGGDGRGAGFLILGGSLNLVDCSLSNHVAQGGMGHPIDGAGGQAQGGAICAFGGQINLTNCLLLNNQSKGGHDYSYLPGTSVPGDAFGGAVYSQGGSIAAHQTQFRSNAAFGGNRLVGFPPSGGGGGAGHANGGALHGTSAVVVLNNCILQGNSAMGGAGGSTGTEGNRARGGALSLSAGTGQVFGTMFLANSVQGGGGDRSGPLGGEGFGGAIHNVGALQIVDSRFSENSARGGGAAFPGRGVGGAISTDAGLAMNKCLLDHNKAIGGDGVTVGIGGTGPAGANGYGGAIYAISNLAFTNVTLFGNQAIGGKGGIGFWSQGASGAGQGGGVCVAGGTASLTHVTIAHNSALGGVTSSTNIGAAQGGGVTTLAGSVVFLSSILSSNLAGSNCFGVMLDGGHNISSDGSCHFSAAGSLNNTDPLLGPLADNGGPTPSMALLTGSPAIDAADPAGCPDTDQRGIARPFGATCDIGAFEFSTPSILGRLFMERIGIGTVRGTFAGEANQTFRVEVSEDMSSWSPYSTNTTASSGLFEFFDTNSAIAEARIFRVSKP